MVVLGAADLESCRKVTSMGGYGGADLFLSTEWGRGMEVDLPERCFQELSAAGVPPAAVGSEAVAELAVAVKPRCAIAVVVHGFVAPVKSNGEMVPVAVSRLVAPVTVSSATPPKRGSDRGGEAEVWFRCSSDRMVPVWPSPSEVSIKSVASELSGACRKTKLVICNLSVPGSAGARHTLASAGEIALSMSNGRKIRPLMGTVLS